MRKLLACVALLAAALGATSAFAQSGNQFFDPNTKKWITYGPTARYGGKSPIKREVVKYAGAYSPGTIIIETDERRLYYVMPGGKAMKYGIGVGREGFQWAGTQRISRKAEWPGWTPPPQMRVREARKGRKLPAYMPGGPNNPLGARALYLGSSYYRIHGSNEPWTIGTAVSSGCIRMANEDVIHLYNLVDVGTRVVVRR
ncbi:L,D-transpeptidase [Stappia sp. F7233]|uniref:L,D-transpeptidase n=1 Tax=Stappia albiluteola TaxID=2758565 RepID=A0A839AA57_9HYPH|nr:L,D-transpeptidase [Stappia albiluteola]MBA5775822.1 L,D-transpeptidase [Stappia albiluteola]